MITELKSIESRDEAVCPVWDLTEFFPFVDGSVILKQNTIGRLKSHLAPAHDPLGETFFSRSYWADYSITVSNSQRCGIDMESSSSAQLNWSINNPIFQDSMLAPGELDRIKKSKYWKLPNLERNIWSSKEALAKALGEAKNYQPNKLYSPILWETNPAMGWHASFREFTVEGCVPLLVWLVLRIGDLQES
mgnify:CR=1 FL=1